jgi:Bacterial Ig-like domain (group 1)
MRRLSIIALMTAAALMAACGGGSRTIIGTPGSSTGGTGGTGSSVGAVSVITSSPQIPSDGGKLATITALVRNAQNQFVAGVAVTFTSTSGGLAVTQGTTDANGAATATLSAAGDATNRTITVTAAAGASTATVDVSVVGTKLTVTGPTSLVLNSQGTYSLALTDAGGIGIANQPVTLKSANGNTLSGTTITTDATGQKTFTLTAAKGGNDTITATALGLTSTAAVAVSTQSFAFTAPTANAQVAIGTSSAVTVQWTAAGVAQTGQTVNFSATRGTLSAPSATISASGTASVTITSTTAGPSVILATGNGVTAQISVDFIATTPSTVAVQAGPSTIVTQGQSTITATVRDANNNLVEGKVVDFLITQDSTGGSLSVASSTTNAQGQASTVYTASTTTSAKDGVVVQASVQGTAVTPATASLTVGGQTVFLSLGTGNTVDPSFSTTQYRLTYSVQAIDNAGHGIDNVGITFVVTSLGYIKGARVWGGTSWDVAPSTVHGDPFDYSLQGVDGCRNEDVNSNGILDAGEDYNVNLKLDPGLVASTDVSSATTANGGSASVKLIYPRDHADYVAVRLTAISTVSGTESSTSTDFWLPALAADVNTQTTAPVGPASPYGIANTCGNKN